MKPDKQAGILRPCSPSEPDVLALVESLTVELADAGYSDDETFGYSPNELNSKGVHLVGARVNGQLIAIGGIETQGDGVGELKRFYVTPDHRGQGHADAVLRELLSHASRNQVQLVRLETGDKQQAAIAFYRRHGFVEIPRFGPYVDSATSVCMQLRLG